MKSVSASLRTLPRLLSQPPDLPANDGLISASGTFQFTLDDGQPRNLEFRRRSEK